MPPNKSEKGNCPDPIESEHVVRCGPDLNLDEVNEIRAELENRYPTRPITNFIFKLFPLSVGAWVLLIRGDDHEEIDTLGCGHADLQLDNVLRRSDALVDRWRANRKTSDTNAQPGDRAK